ncbi:hypothetical protein SNE40_004659 [Patella caerulea]|uniref:Zinc transporter ZIP3 n=1 Tax=Patella caerulea TaxID=87958 RepID=A0AAN8K9A3_PATCE
MTTREIDMEVVVAKIISLLLITTFSVLAGLSPLRLMKNVPKVLNQHKETVEYVLCGLRCFSGGLFLATCFLHLVPDTIAKVEAVMRNLGSRSTFAVAELLIMAGFYAVVFVEQIIQLLYVRALTYEDSEEKTNQCDKNNLNNSEDHFNINSNHLSDTFDGVSLNSLPLPNHTDHVLEDMDKIEVIPETVDYEIESTPLQELEVKKVVSELSKGDVTNGGHYRSIIYLMALAFHGIFEGMTLGLQSVENHVWSLCFAISVHRCVLAFKLGMDLCSTNEKQGTSFLCVGTFTLISAVGIVIGTVISSGAMLYDDVSVPDAILQSLATGTIIYIIFFDILFKDLEGQGDLKRISCSFVGFTLMAIIFAITQS